MSDGKLVLVKGIGDGNRCRGAVECLHVFHLIVSTDTFMIYILIGSLATVLKWIQTESGYKCERGLIWVFIAQ